MTDDDSADDGATVVDRDWQDRSQAEHVHPTWAGRTGDA